jgi:hypothetical protein
MKARMFGSLLSLALLAALPASASADGRVASATGVKNVNGETMYVDVVVAVPRGQSDRQATDQALAQQGARRAQKPPWAGGPGSGGGGGGDEQYFYTGLKWNSPVTQHYNQTGQRVSTAGTALNTSQSNWSNISNSTYTITGGTDTSRCPSLVQQCTGPQVTDGFNDVGWASLGGTTLGVTWSTTSGPEADMALNTRFTWKNTCTSSGGSAYDVGTVFLHENGHVAGLDHANRTDSVMYPSYQAPQCSPLPYDERAMANLY